MQPDVQQHDVGFYVGDQCDRGLRFAGLPHDLHAALVGGQHRAQPVEHHLVVIDDQEPRR